MKVFIAGMDGYLGWSLKTHLEERGYTVVGCDNYLRRNLVKNVGSDSLTPLHPTTIPDVDLTDWDAIDNELRTVVAAGPIDVVVHLAEIPSAPYSMQGVSYATHTHRNNVEGTLNLMYAMMNHCPAAHLVKLGSLGEYGTPNVPISEGDMTVSINGRTDMLPFPRQANSWYHLTKVHDSNNIAFACRNWGLRCTDIMQGVVYGIGEGSRFDYDHVFGTVINRFCTQAVKGVPLTVYGTGGQTRGFIPLRDSMHCIELLIENGPIAGEHRVVNQYAEQHSIIELAKAVYEAADKLHIHVTIDHRTNPRNEHEAHFYEVERKWLDALGYKSTANLHDDLTGMLTTIIPLRDAINLDVINPKVRWSQVWSGQQSQPS